MTVTDILNKFRDSGKGVAAAIDMENIDEPFSALMQDEENSSIESLKSVNHGISPKVSRSITVVHWTIHILLLGLLAFVLQRNHNLECRPKSPVFSPADRAIDYEVVKFHSGLFSDKTKYQGPPSPEVDEAWMSLYRGRYKRLPNFFS